MIRRLLAATRFFIIVPVVGMFFSGLVLMFYGIRKVYNLSLQLFTPESKDKELIVAFVEAIDIFLLSVAFYIIALGLYELFVDNSLELPEWLTIRDFSSLKSKLLDVVVVILGVSFLGNAATWNGDWKIVGLGVAVCAVMIGVKFYAGKNEYFPKK
mgnify:CR=1 FL=1